MTKSRKRKAVRDERHVADRLESIRQLVTRIEGCVRKLAGTDSDRIASKRVVANAARAEVDRVCLELCFLRNAPAVALEAAAADDDEREEQRGTGAMTAFRRYGSRSSDSRTVHVASHTEQCSSSVPSFRYTSSTGVAPHRGHTRSVSTPSTRGRFGFRSSTVVRATIRRPRRRGSRRWRTRRADRQRVMSATVVPFAQHGNRRRRER